MKSHMCAPQSYPCALGTGSADLFVALTKVIALLLEMFSELAYLHQICSYEKFNHPHNHLFSFKHREDYCLKEKRGNYIHSIFCLINSNQRIMISGSFAFAVCYKRFGAHQSFSWGHWCPSLGFLVILHNLNTLRVHAQLGQNYQHVNFQEFTVSQRVLGAS